MHGRCSHAHALLIGSTYSVHRAPVFDGSKRVGVRVCVCACVLMIQVTSSVFRLCDVCTFVLLHSVHWCHLHSSIINYASSDTWMELPWAPKWIKCVSRSGRTEQGVSEARRNRGRVRERRKSGRRKSGHTAQRTHTHTHTLTNKNQQQHQYCTRVYCL